MSMSVFKSGKKRKPLHFLWGIMLAAVGLLAVVVYSRRGSGNLQEDDGRMAEDLARLSAQSYESVLLSMHSTQSFQEEDFSVFLNQDALIASHCILDLAELSDYLDCVFRSGNGISHVYLSLDPELLWNAAGGNSRRWSRSLSEYLYPYIEAHPDVPFEILLPYPYIDYWLSFSEKKLDSLLTLYRSLVDGLCAYPNVKTYFPGQEFWLMINPDNYEESLFDVNEIVAQKLFLYTFCDAVYQITPQNGEDVLRSLRETILREKNSPTRYPDLSGWSLVLFGDSILGNFDGSYSIPGYINGLSGATVYNYAVGGSSASLRSEKGSDFPMVADSFLAGDSLVSKGCRVFSHGEAPEGAEGRKLCFLINFGINDYLSGTPLENPSDPFDITTYKGALRTYVSRLQADFPDACYILISPTHIINQEGDIPLADYCSALQEISEEMDTFYLDNYDSFVITQDNLWDYLSDGYHPNERGRLAMAADIMYFMEENLP